MKGAGLTCTHWGTYQVEAGKNGIISVTPYAGDKEPSAIGASLHEAMDPRCRIPRPMIREGFLRDGRSAGGSGRGKEPFVPVDWNTALDLTAAAIADIRSTHGNESIFGGSYGWASAGRFHHAQSQLHRFLRHCGGYTDSVNSYSFSAAEVIMPHVLGQDFFEILMEAPPWDEVLRHTRLLVAFGGIGGKNLQVNNGGIGVHSAGARMRLAHDAGIEVVNISPLKGDMPATLDARWLAPRPNTDTALMMGLAHTLVIEGLHDRGFLGRYCTGYERFEKYLLGDLDGTAKSAEWAAAISGLPPTEIRHLARRMASRRTLITISWSLQRAEHGEQPYWMATVLGAMLGQIGLPGGGVGYGYGSQHSVGFMGRRLLPFRWAALPQGENRVSRFIPVARIGDMLLNPGAICHYNGLQIRFPDVKMIYWAGGNPFHHHQDLNRLRRAWQRPEVIVVNEPFWTATARHADIVFPSTTCLERNDIACGSCDHYIVPMHRVIAPFASARCDYEIFTGLAERLGIRTAFTAERDEMQWLRYLYDESRRRASENGVVLPEFDDFWCGSPVSLEDQLPEVPFTLERFRSDPEQHPLRTPSGRIEIFSETISRFGYEDCPGHPAWLDKEEWLGSERARRLPLHLISNQPATRLHSQLDNGRTSQQSKVAGHEPVCINPGDAKARSISDGDIVRIFNDRGACLAGARLSDLIRPGVIQLSTGAWYTPIEEHGEQPLEGHGNPNVLTRDAGTSSLAQGCTAHSCLVEVEPFRIRHAGVDPFRRPDVLQ